MTDRSDKPTLLVVDDDVAIRKLLIRLAERAGFEVDAAKDGAEALEMLAARQYTIAIVDLMMPRVSGYELVQKISAMQPHPVVLVATAMANGDLASLEDTMVRRVIRKPFDIQAVAEALAETAREVAERKRAVEQGIVVPDDAALFAKDASVIVDSVAVVADTRAIITQKAPFLHAAEPASDIPMSEDVIEPPADDVTPPEEAK